MWIAEQSRDDNGELPPRPAQFAVLAATSAFTTSRYIPGYSRCVIMRVPLP